MRRIVSTFPRLVWLNTEAEQHWDYSPSVSLTRELIGDRMFPLTLAGLDGAIRELRRPLARSGTSASPRPDRPQPAAP
jgi:hypothetical protein